MVKLARLFQLNGQDKDNFQFNDQDEDNSSSSDSFNEDNGQFSFASFDQMGTDTLSWSPLQFGSGTGAPSFLGYGWSASAPSSSSGGSPQTSNASGPSGSTSGGAGVSSSSQIVSTSGSGLVFDNTYDSSCTDDFIKCIVAAEDQLESLFTNSDKIVVTFNEANQGKGFALDNFSHGILTTYSKLKAALLKVAPSDVLPATDPSGGSTQWYVPYAYARILGLSNTTGSPDDLSVTLNTFYSWDFGQDVINGLTHELSEGGMGRIGGLGGGGSGHWGTMDLFRYNAAGDPDYSNGRDGDTTYFSNDGGTTLSNQNLPGKGAPTLSYNNQYNTSGTKVNKGDTADWTQTHVFGSTDKGETLALTQTELDVMEALGWNLSLKQDVYEEALGGWETPTNWSTGSMPIEAQDAYIGSASGAIVTLNSNVIVHSIATSAGAELAIGNSTASTLIAYDGTVLNSEDTSSVASGNLGKLGVDPGSALQIGNTFDNAGTLAIGKGAGGSGDNKSYLYLDDTLGAVTLDGGGKLDLGQLANSSDDEILTQGEILNAPGTSSDGLINVDNTISGGGVINLGSFDNQAKGTVEASQPGGFWLQIIAPTFTNEGTLAAESGAVLNLGKNGGAGSLTNTGAIDLSSKGDLAISGKYTISGSGAIDFKGAGAEITSDGKAAATFTNDSAINAVFSGQIGDVGVFGSNDLTFDNDGKVTASGSGVKLTINTGSDTVVNESSGVLEAEDDAILAILSNITNQNVIAAGSSTTSGTVDLGEDGGSGTMNNTGAVAVYGGGHLAISGDYTITGSGALYFKGAGAEITSDGKAAETFTNKSDIEAGASGQIGDQGIESTNDLTFVNAGSVVASGSGVTLTLNTGSHTIDDGGGLLEAEDDAILAIDSNVDTGQPSSGSPPGGTIEAGHDGTVKLSADVADGVSGSSVPGQVVIDGGVFELLAGSSVSVPIEFTAAGTLEILDVATVSVSGSNGAIKASSGDKISLTSGTGDTITGAGFTITASSGTKFTVGGNGLSGANDVVDGSHVTVGLEANSHMSVVGSSDTITMAAGSDLAVSGSTDAITATTDDKISLTSGTGDTITGAGFTVTASSGTEFTVGGNGLSGANDVVDGSHVTVGLDANSHMSVVGSSDTITMAAGSDLAVSGSTDAITATTGDKISLTSGTDDTITGAGFTVTASSGTEFTVGGNGLSGANDVVDGSHVTVGLETNSHMSVAGSSDTITMGASSDLTVSGSTDMVTATTGDKISLTSGTGDTITGADFTATAGSGIGLKIKGTGDIVLAGLNDALTDGGSSDTFKIGSNVGSLEISGFGSDPTGIVDLLNGVGGYATAAAAFHALTSDGAGGSLLSLGIDGSIDLLGVAPGALKVTNFKIG